MRRLVALSLSVVLAGCAGTQARRQEKELLGARRAFARALLERGDLGAAHAVLQPLLREHPHDAETLALRGVVYRDQGMLDEAEADLKEALARDGDLAAAHSAIAILYDLRHEARQAEEHHRLAVELEPRNPRYLNNLAFSLFAHGQARDAIPLYLEAVRHDPANPRVRNNLGFAYAVSGDWPRAKRQFEAVGTPSDARLNLGYAYEKAGQTAQAFDLYTEAVRLDPSSKYARESLARVAAKLGKPVPPDTAERAGAEAPGKGG